MCKNLFDILLFEVGINLIEEAPSPGQGVRRIYAHFLIEASLSHSSRFQTANEVGGEHKGTGALSSTSSQVFELRQHPRREKSKYASWASIFWITPPQDRVEFVEQNNYSGQQS